MRLGVSCCLLHSQFATRSPFFPFLITVGIAQGREAKLLSDMAGTISIGAWRIWFSRSIKQALQLAPGGGLARQKREPREWVSGFTTGVWQKPSNITLPSCTVATDYL